MSTTKQYRYRDLSNGVTHVSLERMANPLLKIGKPLSIKGYKFRSTRHAYNMIREAVMITGDKGTARFEGFLWGYSGEGPRGLSSLLQKLGISEQNAENIAYHTPYNNDIGIDWEIKIDNDCYTITRVIK